MRVPLDYTYSFATGACVEPYGNWTRVIAGRQGFVQAIEHALSPERLLHAGAAATTAADRGALAERVLGSAPMPRSHPLLVQLARVWRLSGRWPAPYRLASTHCASWPSCGRLLRLPARPRLRGRPGRAHVRERPQPRRPRAHARALRQPGLPACGAQPGLDPHRGQLDVRELALRGTTTSSSGCTSRATTPTTSCATCSWWPWGWRSPATWPTRPRRRASCPVGLHRLGRVVRG